MSAQALLPLQGLAGLLPGTRAAPEGDGVLFVPVERPPLPPDAIGIEQAGDQILDGIRNETRSFPSNDDARRLYRAIRKGLNAWRKPCGL